jgi:hypothetical protein
MVERTNSWHNHRFKKLALCTEQRTCVIDTFIALAGAVSITRHLLARVWHTYRWDTRWAVSRIVDRSSVISGVSGRLG